MELQIRSAIRTDFWPRLVRELTTEKAAETLYDSKLNSDLEPAIFLPISDNTTEFQKQYYSNGGQNVQILPNKECFKDDDFIQKISNQPGILGLAFQDEKPVKYLVPGGRFNEFYGWDSYFIALGLINDDQAEYAKGIADQFAFEIHNYGKILNANRPYYLGRSQPPFLTDLAWRLHDQSNATEKSPEEKADFVNWIHAAITEHDQLWMADPRYDSTTNLYKYVAQGYGIPPETEPGHFDAVLKPFADKHGLNITEFINRYNRKWIREPELDTYLLHDRSLRESGHDVSTRFVNCCADLVTIDLASLLYKYESDIYRAISLYPDDFKGSRPAQWWKQRAELTKESANKYLWNEEAGVFCDYNVRAQAQHFPVVSATTFWALWSGLASADQARSIRDKGLEALELDGGLAAASNTEGAGRQWDYPAGWAPHQILAWEGLQKYGFHEDAKRLATKWVRTVAKAAQQTNGALFEKYDVSGVDHPQDLLAEYGNQGNEKTGFGWTNAAFALAYDKFI